MFSQIHSVSQRSHRYTVCQKHSVSQRYHRYMVCQKHSVSQRMVAIIGNCVIILVLSSALPILSKTLGKSTFSQIHIVSKTLGKSTFSQIHIVSKTLGKSTFSQMHSASKHSVSQRSHRYIGCHCPVKNTR